LLVDDLLYNLDALKIFIDISLGLGKANEICDTAKNGLEAVQMVLNDCNQRNHSSYKIIFMDGNMPRMDGYEAAERIRHYFFTKNL